MNRESEGKTSGIPHLAKNERDMGHPSFVRERKGVRGVLTQTQKPLRYAFFDRPRILSVTCGAPCSPGQGDPGRHSYWTNLFETRSRTTPAHRDGEQSGE